MWWSNYQTRHFQKQPFLRKGVRKMCSKFTGEHPCWSVILIKLLWNFMKWLGIKSYFNKFRIFHHVFNVLYHHRSNHIRKFVIRKNTSYELRVEILKARVKIQKCKFKILELRVQIHELRVQISRFTSSNPSVISLNPRVASSNPRVMSSNPRVTSSNSLVTSSNPRLQESLNQWKLMWAVLKVLHFIRS